MIKKAIRNKFRFGKKFVDVQNCEVQWIRVPDPKLFRVYIVINHARHIKCESVVPFHGTTRWLVQVESLIFYLAVSLLDSLQVFKLPGILCVPSTCPSFV